MQDKDKRHLRQLASSAKTTALALHHYVCQLQELEKPGVRKVQLTEMIYDAKHLAEFADCLNNSARNATRKRISK